MTELDPILLDVERLVAALETGVFELRNTRVHQNLLLHHIGRSMARSAVLLQELCNMAGHWGQTPIYPVGKLRVN